MRGIILTDDRNYNVLGLWLNFVQHIGMYIYWNERYCTKDNKLIQQVLTILQRRITVEG